MRQKIETIPETAPFIYFAYDGDQRISEVNRTLCQDLGYSREELIGQRIEMLFTVATKVFQQTHFFPLLKMQSHAEEIFITLKAKNEDHLPVLINAVREESDGEIRFVHAGIIVHHRKRFEDELIAARKSAEAALHENKELLALRERKQKQIEELDRQLWIVDKQNEELKQFNRVITHDLQEPLRKLFVFVNMLVGSPGQVNLKETADRLLRVLQQMNAILSGLQQYIWLTEATVKSAAVDLNRTLDAAGKQLKEENPGVELKLRSDELPVIEADAEQLQLLFYQVLSNAVRFRSADIVHILVRSVKLKRNQFRQIADKYRYEEMLKIDIMDDGIGFNEIYKSQVFELFRRLHEHSGSGVGLPLCKKIVENHGGEIDITSKEYGGTTVTVYLPVQQTAMAQPAMSGG